MKVILTMDVAEIGSRGDRVDVAAGYARNYLIPRRLAVPETPGNLRIMKEEEKLAGVRDRKARKEAEHVGSVLGGIELFTTLKIGGEGKAFGAITSKDIAVLLRKKDVEVDRRKIALPAPIKRLGVFEIPLRVHSEVETTIRLAVDREGGSPEGARTAQLAWEAEAKVAEAAARAEAEARDLRQREAEEAARIAVEKSAARKAREEEAARARQEADARARGQGDASEEAPAAESQDAAATSEKAPAKKKTRRDATKKEQSPA
jgi:large subunit ribosomal protein L9